MQYSGIAAGIAASVVLLIIGDKLNKDKLKTAKYLKALSLALFCLFSLRFLTYNSNLIGLTLVPQSFSDLLFPSKGAGKAVQAILIEWFSLCSAMLLTCKGFFKSKTLDRLVLFALPVYCVISVVFLNSFVEFSILDSFKGIPASGAFSTGKWEDFAAVVLYGLETGVTVSLVGYYWVKAIINKDIPLIRNFKDAGLFGLCLILAIAAATPNYTLQFFFGVNAWKCDLIKGFSLWHRVVIYGAIIMPFVFYFSLKKQPSDTIRFVLTYFSLAAMFVYCYTVTFTKLVKEPTSWPIHLCNTAMYLVPLCLVFRWKKLFYFTYFINVFGALLAMLMPNYDYTQRVLADETIRFWYNHYCAFFMPLLLVALRQFDRPNLTQFKFSILGFLMYFLFALFMNVLLNGIYAPSVTDDKVKPACDYFFLYGTHIVDTVGEWAKKIYSVRIGFSIGAHTFEIRPVYQSLFFVVYVGMGLVMWFIYELGFSLADACGALYARSKKIKVDRLALEVALAGRSIEEPMNKDAGIKLELKHFSKKYSTSKNYAVHDANLEVHGGEIFGFLGPNGAGKSTIIKSIVGIQPITEGAIEVCGFDCEKQPVQAKSIIGYVPDHYALYEKLTGREYINYVADIYGVSQEDRTARIEKHIVMFELQGSIDNPIKTYSHGMKQKITIMAALVHNPKLWILDEPLTGLDPNSIYQVKECMKQHAAEGNIVFFSSHIIDVVERICDRITIIKKGHILVTRDVEDIEKECPLEEYYLKMIGGEEK